MAKKINGSNSNDNLYGSWKDDEIRGKGGDDQLFGNGGDDFLDGGDGNDRLHGGWGDDELIGGAGNDVIYGNGGRDEIDGGSGDDEIYGGSGDDEIEGGSGNDTIYGNGGDDEIDAGSGDDVVYGGSGHDVIEGGSGNDTIHGNGGHDELSGGSGDDTILGGWGNDQLDGGEGDDVIRGNGGHDVIDGGAGNDDIEGGWGDDRIDGGSGDDVILGKGGHDTIDGGAGNDDITSDWGNDRIDAGSGDDVVHAAGGNDHVTGGAGSDEIYGGDGDDVLIGDDGASYGSGHGSGSGHGHGSGSGGGYGSYGGGSGSASGSAHASGGSGSGAAVTFNDYLDGGNGNDILLGEQGDDTLLGGAGNDFLDGGKGTDSVDGGFGNDTGLFVGGQNGGGTDSYDGNTGTDTLVISLTGAQYDDSGIRTDLVALKAFIEANANPNTNAGPSLTLGSLGLQVQDWEELVVLVDGQPVEVEAPLQGLFTINPDSVDFDDVDAGTYIAGTQYDALESDDTVYMASDAGEAADAGYDPSETFNAGAGNDTVYGRGLDDSIEGGAGDDHIEGGAGNDTLHGDDPDAFVPASTIIATGNAAAWASAGVTLSGLNFDGSPGTVTYAGNGVGVAGGSPSGDQINHDDTGETQTLIAEFEGPVTEATVTVSNLYASEGGGEHGHWAAYDAGGNLVGEGSFGPEIITTSGHIGSFTISGIGNFTEIRFTAEEYGNGTPSGSSDSSDYFVRSITYTTVEQAPGGNDHIEGGAGDDVIFGEGGDDTLYGDDSSAPSTQTQALSANDGLYDLSGATSVTVTVDYLSSNAGYDNAFGYYLADASGNPISGEIVFADVKNSGAGVGNEVTITIDPSDVPGAVSLGFFIIPNGDNYNHGLSDGDAVTFSGSGCNWDVLKDGSPLSGQGADVLFSDKDLNPASYDHERDTGTHGNQNWEDLVYGGDKDFDDVNLNVAVEGTYEHGGDDTLDGGAGNDFLDGNEGADVVYGNDGDDTGAFVEGQVGGLDIYDGGKGTDTLKVYLTSAQFADADIFADLVALKAFIEANADALTDDGADATFTNLDLNVEDWEALEVYVDGHLTVLDHDAVAEDDAAGAPEGSAVTIDVLDNDDVQDGVASLTIVTGPAQGTATVNPDNTITFDPAGAFEGLAEGETATVTFTYEVTDTDGDSDTATVTVTVTGTNDAPVVQDVSTAAVEDGPAVTASFIGDDADSDDDASTLTYTITSSPAEGAVTNNYDGSFTFETGADFQDLADGETRSVSFTYEATDSHGAVSNSSVVTVTVTGVNDAPVVQDVAIGAAEDGPTVSGAFIGDDADSDDDASTLTYTITSALAEGSIVNNGNGTFTFDPGSDFQDLNDGETRVVTVTYTATDSHGAVSNTGTLTITVTGQTDLEPLFTVNPDSVDFDAVDAGTYIDGTQYDALESDDTVYMASDAGEAADAGYDPSETFHADDGDDTVYGRGLDDSIEGDAGDDTIYGGAGDDTLGGGEGEDHIEGGLGNDTILGGAGNDVLYGDNAGQCDVPGTGLDYDFPVMAHAISNIVLYLREPGGDIVKVKVDSFDQGSADVFDANDVDLLGFVDANFPAHELVAVTVKAGNNASGMGPGEGELFVIDATATQAELENAGGPSGQPDHEFDYAGDLEPLGTPAGGAQLDDYIEGGEGDDEIYGQGGNDILHGDDPDAVVSGTTVTATGNAAAWASAGVTLSGLNFDGSPGTVTYAGNGVGVAGGSPSGDQINHDDTGETQTLIAEFEGPVTEATVTVSNLYASEGGGEHGHWAAYDAGGNLVGEGSFGPEIITTSGHIGSFTISGIGNFTEIRFTAEEYGNGTPSGSSDSSDYFVRSITYTTVEQAPGGNDYIEGGAGNDVIFGEGGDDTLYGDDPDGACGVTTETRDLDPANGLYGLSGASSITVTVDYLASIAGYDNSFGWYFADASGNPISGEVIFADVKNSGPGVGDAVTLTLDPSSVPGAVSLGFFIIPNGENKNPGLSDGDAVTFSGSGTSWDILKDGSPLSGQGADVLFSDNTRNPSSYDHEQDTPADGNQNWEDIVNGGDHDFNDISLNVAVEGTYETAGNDDLDGGAGNDVLDGNEGADFVYGNDGDDVGAFVVGQVGGLDVYDGGKGTDTLKVFLTSAQYADPDIQADLAALKAFIEANSDPLTDDGADATFTHLDINVEDWEALEIYVDGDPLDDDNPADAIDDAADAGENLGVTIDVLANDNVPDGVASVAIVTPPSQGTVILNPDNTITFDPSGSFEGLSEGETATVTFTYEVTDTDGDTDIATVTVTVAGTNDAPVVQDVSTSAEEDGAAVTAAFIGDDPDSDDDGSTLTYTLTSSPSEGSVTNNNDGTFSFDPGSDFQDMADGETRDVTFTYEATDSHGAVSNTGTITVTVTGNNDEPTITVVPGNGDAVDGEVKELADGDAGENTADLTASGTITFDDADLTDGHTISSSANGTGYIGSFNATIGSSATGAAAGAIAWSFEVNDGLLDRLNEGEQLVQSYDVTVDDGNGGTATQTVTITIEGTNDAPVVQDVTVTGAVEDGAAVTDSFVGDDADAEDDGSTLTYTITSIPSEGSVVNNNDGTFSFDPGSDFQDLAPGETRDVTFTYEATDAQGAVSNTGTVTVTVEGTNDAPVVQDVTAAADEDGAPVAGSFIGDDADSDDDGSTLTYTLTSSPSEGSVTNNNDGTFSFDPGSDFQDLADGETRDVTFTYEATDSHGAVSNTGTITVTVTGNNDEPTITVVPGNGDAVDGEVKELADGDAGENTADLTASGTITFDDADLTDGHTISSSANGTGYIGSFNATIGSSATGATAGAIAWSFEVNDGLLDSLNEGEQLVQSYDVTVDDGNGGTATQTVTITIEGTNDAPVVQDVTVTGAVEDGAPVTDSFVGDDADAEDDGSTLTYTITSIPSEGSVVNNNDGTFSFDPGSDFQGLAPGETRDVTFTYEATDTQGAVSNTGTVTVTVEGTNDAPVVQDISTAVGEDGPAVIEAFIGDDADSDDDGSTLTYTVTSAPSGGSVINNNDGTFSFDPDGDFESLGVGETTDVTFSYEATDSHGAVSNTGTITVTITGANDDPEALDETLSIDENTPNGTYVTTVVASDPDANDTLTYALIGGTGLGVFALDTNTGEITVIDGSQLDYEATPSWTLEVEVDDGNGGTDTATITINLADVNEGPTAIDDDFTVIEDVVLTGNVLADNGHGADSDPDAGETLTVVAATITTAQGGTVTLNANGTFSYTPPLHFSGTDSFDYTLEDSGGLQDTATANISVIADADIPDLVVVDPAIGQVGQPIPLGISVDFPDQDGSEIHTITICNLPNGAVLNQGTENPDGSWTLTPADLAGLTITVTGSQPAFGGTFELDDLDASNGGDGSLGFIVNGSAGDASGFDVASAGDVNGDGYADLIISAILEDHAGVNNAGATYVVFGSAAGFGAELNVDSMLTSQGYTFFGVESEERTGVAVRSAGDVNGDGYDDIYIGAPRADADGNDAGRGYVVFGSAGNANFAALDALDGTSDGKVELKWLYSANGGDGSRGFVLNGTPVDTPTSNDFAGYSIDGGYDFNGDGIEDIIIGARGNDYHNGTTNKIDPGSTYVVFGKTAGWTAEIDLASLTGPGTFTQGVEGTADGSQGVVIRGINRDDQSGFQIAGIEDMTGDGKDEVLIGARFADPNGLNSAGQVYLVYGSDGMGPEFNAASLDGTNGYVFNGTSAGERLGKSVSDAGDVNGDGIADMIFGSYNAVGGTGRAYVVFGGNVNLSAMDADDGSSNGRINLSQLFATNGGDGTNGFVLNGIAGGDTAGWSVNGVGDVNGDGFADVIVGAPRSDPDAMSSAGETYVIFGRAGGFAPEIDLADLEGGDGSIGFTLSGRKAGDMSGWSVNAAGDVNGDGIDDLIIGAYGADPNGSVSGETYVVYGREGISAEDFTITVKANATEQSNGDSETVSDTITIDLNEAPNVDDQTYTIAENTANGTSVGTVIGTDPDAFDTLTYAIVGGSGVGVFQIDATTGEITVIDQSALDYETTTFYTLSVQVTDTFGETDNAIVTINLTDVVENLPPDITDDSVSVEENAANGTFVVNVPVSDPDAGDSHTYTVTGGTGAGIFAIDNNGDVTVIDGSQLDYEGAPTSFTLEVEVEDAGGLTDTATITIDLSDVNEAPDIADDATTVEENAANGTFVLNVPVTDPDAGDTHTYTVIGGTGAGIFAIDNNGDVTVIDGSQLDYEGAPTSFTLEVEVTDAGGLTDTAIITIGLDDVNEAPVVLDVASAAVEDGPAVTAAFDGDDIDADDDGSTLTYTLTSSPAEGAVVNNNDGTFTFDPGTDFQDLADGETRDVTFTYEATDSHGAVSNTGTITVTVTGTNDAPVVQDVTAAADEDGAAVVAAFVGDDADSDDDGSTLTYTITSSPSEGSVANNNDGTFSFDPGSDFQDLAPGETRDVTFTYEATDSHGAVSNTGTVTVTVTGTNDAPVVQDVTAAAEEQGSPVTAAFVGDDVDSDDDSSTLTYTITSSPSEGLVSNNNNGTFDFYPSTDFQDLADGETRDVTFTYEATDSHGAVSNTGTVTITVTGVNDVPVVQDIVTTATEDGPAVTEAFIGDDADSDDDGSTLTYTITSSPSEGSVVNNTDGTFSFNPDTDFQYLAAGETTDVTFTYEATDSHGAVSNTGTITVTVTGVNDDPVAAADAFAGVEDTPVTGNVLADNGNGADSDADNGTTLVVVAGVYATVQGGSVTLMSDGSFTYTPPLHFSGTDSFDYTVEDGDGGSDTATATIEVEAVADAPAIVTETASGPAGTPLALNIAANFPDTDGSEVHTITISGVPAGATLNQGTDQGGGVWTLTPGQLAGLTVTVPEPGPIFGSTFELDLLDASNGGDGSLGFIINGTAGDASGFDVASAGDVNGDGYGDLIISAILDDRNAVSNVGATYVVFGSATGFGAELNAGSMLTSQGYTFFGVEAEERTGVSVRSAGDVNGDGYDDIYIGAPRADADGNDAGRGYVVFGSAGNANFAALDALDGASDGKVELKWLYTANGGDGTKGFVVNGTPVDPGTSNDFAGYSIDGGYDFNGDGIEDIIIGARGNDFHNGTTNKIDPGSTYVIFGKTAGWTAEIDLSEFTGPGTFTQGVEGTATGSDGVVIRGINRDDQSGFQISGIEDMNGDGKDEVLIGARFADPNGLNSAGQVYLVYGSDSMGPEFNAASLNGTNGYVFNGTSAGERLGKAVDNAGDVNGDGIADMVFGSYNASGATGRAYVVFGGTANLAAMDAADSTSDGKINLSELFTANGGDGTTGFVLNGVDGGDTAGWYVAGAGDINGDGFADMIVGAPRATHDGMGSSGESYVILGKAGGFAPEINLADLESGDGTDGFLIAGRKAGDMSGWSVNAAGDVNGDGIDDLMIGAYGADPNGSVSGETYVIYGRTDLTADDFTLTVTGTATENSNSDTASTTTGLFVDTDGSADDTIEGTAGDDVFDAGAGDDTFASSAGDDILTGGTGDDLFVFADGSGADQITDFTAGAGSEDVIDVTSFGFADFNDLLSASTDVGLDVVIALDNDDSVTLIGVQSGDLHQDDFLL